jgi:DNA repair protein REV1
VALRKYPELRDKPVAISHLGEERNATERMRTTAHVSAESTSECATCNYEARKFGIKKGMFLGRARTLCPDLVILPYDFEGYEEVSDAVSAILDRYASENSGYVEHVSCDEAYVECHVQITDGTSSVDTVRELAESIRMEIFDVTQCTATVGVGQNKLLAKLATDHVKPNKSFVIEHYRDLLRTMKLRELHGIGYRMERKLAEEELETVQDVWDMGTRGESELCRILGPALGKKIYGFCHGNDDRPIQPAERKTIGAEVSS